MHDRFKAEIVERRAAKLPSSSIDCVLTSISRGGCRLIDALKIVITFVSFVSCLSCDKPAKEADSHGRIQEQQNHPLTPDPQEHESKPSSKHSTSNTVLIHAAKSNTGSGDFKIEVVESVRQGRSPLPTARDGGDLSSFPISKRIEVARIRKAKEAIDAKREQAIESQKPLTPQMEIKLRAEWIRNNQKEYSELEKAEERIVWGKSGLVIPTQLEITALSRKFDEPLPTFTENDMPVLEHMIPPAHDLVSKHQKEDFSIRQMLTVYRGLGAYFPQSVNRPELVQIAKTAGL